MAGPGGHQGDRCWAGALKGLTKLQISDLTAHKVTDARAETPQRVDATPSAVDWDTKVTDTGLEQSQRLDRNSNRWTLRTEQGSLTLGQKNSRRHYRTAKINQRRAYWPIESRRRQVQLPKSRSWVARSPLMKMVQASL